LNKSLENKYSILVKYLKSLTKVIIAYSGGVDSTFLLYSAVSALGNKNVLAVIAVSETYTKDELKSALKFCKQNNIQYKIIKTNELNNPFFKKNPPERCYFCKKELFSKLLNIAKKQNIKYVADGTNKDDSNDFRPGEKAKKELGIISPLALYKFTKDNIRKLSKVFMLPTFNKPSQACLSSRFPYGTEITIKKIKQIEYSESYLKKLGLSTIRVRNHNPIARIECNLKDFKKIISNKSKVINYFKKFGFKYITLDLEGFRSGSMNEVL
jgi:uncharacterized protein